MTGRCWWRITNGKHDSQTAVWDHSHSLPETLISDGNAAVGAFRRRRSYNKEIKQTFLAWAAWKADAWPLSLSSLLLLMPCIWVSGVPILPNPPNQLVIHMGLKPCSKTELSGGYRIWNPLLVQVQRLLNSHANIPFLSGSWRTKPQQLVCVGVPTGTFYGYNQRWNKNTIHHHGGIQGIGGWTDATERPAGVGLYLRICCMCVLPKSTGNCPGSYGIRKGTTYPNSLKMFPAPIIGAKKMECVQLGRKRVRAGYEECVIAFPCVPVPMLVKHGTNPKLTWWS